MEEGPEPQEWVERTVEEHHHEHESGAKPPGTMVSAVTAAVLAVLAAIGSLLSGHAANQAILLQSKATDQWAFYQAKASKGHLYEVGAEVVTALSGQSSRRSDEQEATLRRFHDEAKRYEQEKAEIKKEADSLEAESRHEFHKHHRFALGIAAFQVGIVLASVSILVRARVLYLLSLSAGLLGFGFVIGGLLA